MAKVNETDQHDAQQVATQALADCEGSKDDALLLLAHLLINARRGMCSGFQRLGPLARRPAG
ncbi:hypothetical protein GAY28_14545 [Azospirillum brasilense]|nr:hypothetical protein [Azospirillum brasilense]